MPLWMVRCGRHGEGESVALEQGVVGIGWEHAGDLTGLNTTEAVRTRLQQSYTDTKPATLTNWVGQVDAFVNRIQVGDLVALPLKSTPAVAFGRITSGYRYSPEAPESVRHQRTVKWIREDVPREAIDQDLLYSLGAFMTVCRIKRNDAEKRIEALLAGKRSSFANQLPEDDAAEAAPVDIAELSRDLIRAKLADTFVGHDLARLVGELLRAQGFITQVSPAGPDGGVDVLAGQGGMGFDGNRIVVQVKSGGVVSDTGTLRELQGVMANFKATHGLLVSWSGFTKTARVEARRLFFEIRLWDSNDVIARVQELYHALSSELQAELPLRQIWTLVSDEHF
jgi:restriction system protein